MPAVNGGAESGDDAPSPTRKSAFAAMTIHDEGDDGAGKQEEKSPPDDVGEEDFGGLMSAIKKSDKKDKKKGKKGKKKDDDDIWDELGEDVAGNAVKDGTQGKPDDEQVADKASEG